MDLGRLYHHLPSSVHAHCDVGTAGNSGDANGGKKYERQFHSSLSCL